MASSLPKTWIERYRKGLHHKIPLANFGVVTQRGKSLFHSRINGEPIDLYVYNADTADLVFGRANLKGGYPRELAHHARDGDGCSEVRMDQKYYSKILAELKAKHYLSA